tara:strand:- start:371 stop:727 length:357 start_codon:yes stop_codon:yes gene_type:complete
MVEDNSPFNLLQKWKQKKYKKTNYENIHAYYNDVKYIRIKPKSNITLSPGFLSIILKHPTEWVMQNFKLESDVTLSNETNNVVYFTLEGCLLSKEDKEYKLHIKNGIPKNEEKWEIDI